MTNRKFIFSIKAIFDKTGITKTTTALKTLNTTVETTDKEFVKTAKTGKKSFKQLTDSSKKLNDTLSQLKTTATKTFSAFKKGASIALKPLQLLGGAVATFYGALATYSGFALDAAGDLEMYKVQLEAVMESAEAAAAAFQESMDFSVKTPFEPDEIIQTRVLLEGVGVKGQEAVKSVATAAAALNRNILDVGTAVISMETEPLRRMGIQLKKNGDEFIFSYRDKMNQAVSLTVNGFSQAQEGLLEILETKYDGGLDKMAQTFQGKLSTMKGAWKQFMASFGDGVMGPAKDILDDIINMLNEGIDSKKAEELGKWVGGKVAEFRENLSGAFDAAKKIATGIGKLMQDDAKGLGEVLNKIMESTGELLVTAVTESFKASLSLWSALGSAIWNGFEEKWLASPLGNIMNQRENAMASAVNNTSAGDVSAWAQSNNVQMPAGLVEGAQGGNLPMLHELIRFLSDLPRELQASFASLDNAAKTIESLKDAGDSFQQALSAVKDKAKSELQEIDDLIKAKVSDVTTTSDKATAEIEAEGSKVFDASGNVAAAYDSAGNKLGDSSENFIAIVEDVATGAKAVYDSAEDFAAATKKMNEGAEIIGGASTAIKEKTEEAQTQVKAATESFKKVADDSAGGMKDSISAMGGSVKQMADTTTQGLNQINANLSTTYNTINSTLQSILSQLADTQRTAAKAEYQASLNQSQLSNMR